MVVYEKYRNVKISISCSLDNIDNITKMIEEHFSNITKIERRIANDNEYLLKLNVTTRKNLRTINDIFKACHAINKIDIQEVYE